jgi:hypothetical protein
MATGFLIIIPAGIAILSVWLLRESPKWKYDREEVVRKQKNTTIFSAGYQLVNYRVSDIWRHADWNVGHLLMDTNMDTSLTQAVMHKKNGASA